MLDLGLYFLYNSKEEGSVPERLNGPDSKSGIRETVSEVRILPLPPEIKRNALWQLYRRT